MNHLYSSGSPPPEEVAEDQYDGEGFEDEEGGQEQAQAQAQQQDANVWYTLTPPPTHSRGHYIHTVYVDNNRGYRDNPSISEAKKQKMLKVLGFLSSENYVLVSPSFSQVRCDEISLMMQYCFRGYRVARTDLCDVCYRQTTEHHSHSCYL
jgi:hypothetical protein